MGALAERLSPFLWVLARWRGTAPNLGDHLMYPAGASGPLRGSDLGRSLWETPEAVALLDLIEADPEFVAAFAHGVWNKRDEARRIVASVGGQWAERPLRAELFAEQIEASLWDSLRRTDFIYSGLTIIDGVTVSSPGVPFGYGRLVIPPSDPLMGTAFSRAWPDFWFRIPSGPFALILAQVSVPRPYFGGGMGSPFARTVADEVRDAIWLSTGHLVPLGTGVVWEEHAIPLTGDPYRFEAERGIERPRSPVSLDGLEPQLTAITRRLAVLDGSDQSPPELDRPTLDTLRLLRAQVGASIHAASDEACLLQVNAAIEGSLRRVGENDDLARSRFGFFCGADTAKRRELRKWAECLDPIRDAIAHGDRPKNRQIAAFIGQPVAEASRDDEPWSPEILDPSPRLARERALDLLRRLYRSWLLATLQPTDSGVEARMTREQLLALIDRARRVGGAPQDQAADEMLLDLNTRTV